MHSSVANASNSCRFFCAADSILPRQVASRYRQVYCGQAPVPFREIDQGMESMRLSTLLIVMGILAFAWDAKSATAQGFGLPGGTGATAAPSNGFPTTGATTSAGSVNSGPTAVQSLGQSPVATTSVAADKTLPSDAGQKYRKYDLSPYTGHLKQVVRPEQAVVDWIIRETGSDAWFSPPFGFLNADHNTLSVYHTPEMHQVVGEVVEKFVAGDTEPQVLSVKVLNVGNPNWRNRAHLLMQHVGVDSPGVQAWLLSKENAAMVMNQLRQRTDTRIKHDLNLVLHNGQTQKLTSTLGKNYVRNMRQTPTGWPPYEPETGEIHVGYKVEISPLLSTDGKVIDCVIKAEIDQLDKLLPVDLELPLQNNQVHRAQIDVPQVVSWRLNERFRWPSDMILLLSCGVVASPDGQPASPMSFLNIDMLTGTTTGRADALMFIQFKGRASANLTHTGPAMQMAAPQNPTSRGRY